jgi:hypothetical protein
MQQRILRQIQRLQPQTLSLGGGPSHCSPGSTLATHTSWELNSSTASNSRAFTSSVCTVCTGVHLVCTSLFADGGSHSAGPKPEASSLTSLRLRGPCDSTMLLLLLASMLEALKGLGPVWTPGSEVEVCLSRGWLALLGEREEEPNERNIASFQISNGGERRHIMFVGARSGSNPGPVGSG